MFSYEGRTSALFPSEEPDMITSQRKYELEELIKVYKIQAPKYVLEIGTQDGGTLYQWIKHAPPGAVIVNIDILENQHDPQGTLDRWHSWKRDDIELYSFIGRSQGQDAIEFVKERLPEINFLFIDGDHRYRGVKEDFVNYSPMVNGIVAFHDLMTPKSGLQDHITVGRLWREIQHVGYATREIWCSEDPDWGGIGVVYHVPAQKEEEVKKRAQTEAEIRAARKSGHLPLVRFGKDRTR